ncbi:unnamed protein product [Arctogadus glacialis]
MNGRGLGGGGVQEKEHGQSLYTLPVLHSSLCPPPLVLQPPSALCSPLCALLGFKGILDPGIYMVLPGSGSIEGR